MHGVGSEFLTDSKLYSACALLWVKNPGGPGVICLSSSMTLLFVAHQLSTYCGYTR